MSNPPTISNLACVEEAGVVTISCDAAGGDYDVNHVICTIYPPHDDDYDPGSGQPLCSPPTVKMTDLNEDGTYEGTYTPTKNGWHRILVMAYDMADTGSLVAYDGFFYVPFVASGGDDACEETGGAVSTSEATLRTYGKSLIGVRFQLFVPQGAIIDQVALKLFNDSNTVSSFYVDIYAEDTDDSAAFSASANNLSARTKTTAHVAWISGSTPNSWTFSPYINSVIQEVVSRSGWEFGNHITLLLEVDDSTKDARACSCDGDAEYAPQLYLKKYHMEPVS